MLCKNQIIALTIESVTSSGSGIGHYEGMAIFVPQSAAGDQLNVRIVKVLSAYCFGIIESIVVPSPDRITPDCGAYRQCGGCVLRHISYEAELLAKADWVRDALQRIGGFTLEPEPIIPSPRADGYRNKAQYPFGHDEKGTYCGFFATRSHRVIRCSGCPLQPTVFARIAESVCRFADQYNIPTYDEATGKGLLRHLYLRQAEHTGELMLCLVINGDSLPRSSQFIAEMTANFPQIASIVLNRNLTRGNVILGERNTTLWGKDTLTDVLCGVGVDLSPHSFYQVNHDGAEQLYRCAAEMANLRREDLLLDLYCGAGTIGLSMSQQIDRLVGVEIVPSAVENARKNAERAGITNARFLCADAAEAVQQLAAEGLHPDIIVMDPPRKGCDRATLEAAVAMSPRTIVMVSCNPATMARDAKLLDDMGYHLTRARPVDMFPRTAHVETVVLMSRVDK